MSFTVPVSVNYASPLNAVPLDWTSEPNEGAKGIQCSITWNASESGANKSVYLNMQNNAPLNFSKIRALVFDNSANGSDVQVIFPDTETTVSIPAYTPYAVIPVFTNIVQFYIQSPNALATDKTNFMILNTLPPPVVVPTTQEQSFDGEAGIDATSSGSTQLVAAGINGTLEAVSVGGFIVGGGTGGSITVDLVDGGGNTIMIGVRGTDTSQFQNMNIFELSGLQVRFTNGLQLVWTTVGAPVSCFLNANVYYRTP
jgi:hypothetical protein